MKKINIILISLALTLAGNAQAKERHQDLSGKAHDFTLKSNTGKNIRLSELKGNVVMLNFWASWCGPCRKEMPLLNKLHARYEPAGFKLLSINTEASKEDADGFLAKTPVDFPVLYDNKQMVSDKYKLDAMPTSVLIDCDGNMTYLHRGYQEGDISTYKSKIKKLLASCK